MANVYSKAQLTAAAKFISCYVIKHNKSALKQGRVIRAVVDAAKNGIDITDEEQLKKIGRDLIAEARSATDAIVEMLCKASGATIIKVDPDTVEILQKCSEYAKKRKHLDNIIAKIWNDESLSVKDSFTLLSKTATLSKEQLSEIMMYTALIPDLMAMLTFKELVNTYATALNLSKATYTARWVKCYNLRAISEGNRALKALEQLDEDTLLYCLSSLYPGKSVDNIVKDDRLKNYNRKEINADLAYVVELIILTSKDRNTTKYRDIAPFLQFALLGDIKAAVDCYYSIHNEHNSQNNFNDVSDVAKKNRKSTHDIPKLSYSLIDGHELKDTPSGQVILDLYPYIQKNELPPLELLQHAVEVFLNNCNFNELLNAMENNEVWHNMAALYGKPAADLFHDCILNITDRMSLNVAPPSDQEALKMCNLIFSSQGVHKNDKFAITQKDRLITSKYKAWLSQTEIEQSNTDFIFTAKTCKYLSDCCLEHKKLEKQARLEQKKKQEEKRARQLEAQRQQRLEQEKQRKIAEALEFRSTCTYKDWFNHFKPAGKSLADKYAQYMGQTVQVYAQEAEQSLSKEKQKEVARLTDILNSGNIDAWEEELREDSDYVAHLLGQQYVDDKSLSNAALIKGFYTTNKALLQEILKAYNTKYWIDLFISSTNDFRHEIAEIAEAYEISEDFLTQFIKSHIITDNSTYLLRKVVAEFFLTDISMIEETTCDNKIAQYVLEHAQQYIQFGRTHYTDNWVQEYANATYEEFTSKYINEAQQQNLELSYILDQVIAYLDYCILELDKTNNTKETTDSDKQESIPEIVEPTISDKDKVVLTKSTAGKKQITVHIVDDPDLIKLEYEAYYANRPVFWNPAVEDKTAAPKLSRHALISILNGAITIDKLQRFVDRLPSNVLLSEAVYEYSVEELRKHNVKMANRVIDPLTKDIKSIPTMCREHGVTRKYYEEQLAAGKSSLQALVMPDNDLKIIATAYQAQGIKYDKQGNYVIYRGAFAVTVPYTELAKVRQKLGL